MNQKSLREQVVHDAKSNLILDAARKVFSDKGFHETRLEDIAASAGFSKASLYNYFSDKEQIFLNIAIRDFEELLTKLRFGVDNSLPLISTIEFLVRTVFSFFGEQITFFLETAKFQAICKFDMGERLQGHHEKLVGRFQESYFELLSTFAGVLRSARERGEYKSTLDEMTLARFLEGLVRATIFEWKISGKIGDIEQTVRDLLDFSAHGLGCTESVALQVEHSAQLG
jgi:TetR/AcrR family fatty acid metabolism transcriptional regulator